jgi:hypothetical protein
MTRKNREWYRTFFVPNRFENFSQLNHLAGGPAGEPSVLLKKRRAAILALHHCTLQSLLRLENVCALARALPVRTRKTETAAAADRGAQFAALS